MVTYTRTNWINGSKDTPLSAANLNNIENGIEDLVSLATEHDTKIAEHDTKINGAEDNIDAINEQLSNCAAKDDLAAATNRIDTIENTYATKDELATTENSLTTLTEEIETVEKRVEDLENDPKISSWSDLVDKPDVFNPTLHSNEDSSVYGAATTTLYGHVKISNDDVASIASADGLAAGMDHTHSDYAPISHTHTEYATTAEATQSTSGLFSSADKTKLDGIAAGANNTKVVNNLTSTSTTAALSAAQGKELKTEIDLLLDSIEELGGGDMLKAIYDTDGDGIVDNASKLGGNPPESYALADHTHSNYAVSEHTHSGYAELEHTHSNYADHSHTHDDYATIDHEHEEYATTQAATITSDGLLSSSDKIKLDGIQSNANRTVIVDNLTSNSITDALSAAQGKTLNEKITEVNTSVITLSENVNAIEAIPNSVIEELEFLDFS